MVQLPLIYYPTTLGWVDDDELFLQVARERFKGYYPIKTFSSSTKAKDYFDNLNSSIEQKKFFRSCVEHEDYELSDHLPVDINFEEINQTQQRTKKHEDIAVMVIDYNMPEISGIELCMNLAASPIKKILLTGHADYLLAIDAFNKGLINFFISKGDPNIDVLLQENIDKLFKQYFIEKTSMLLNHLESDCKLPHTDPQFIIFFEKLCKQNKIKEYYLADKIGGMLLIAPNGGVSYLLIHTDRTLNKFVDLHQNDNEALFFVKSVNNRNKIPFFGIGKESWNVEIRDWVNCFYSPQIIKGRETYYWSIIDL